MKTTRASVRKLLAEKKELNDEVKKGLVAAIEEFQAIFARG
jgi:hypothetical protein